MRRAGSIRYASSEIERVVDELDLGDGHARMAHQILRRTLESEYQEPSLDVLVPATVYLADRVIGPEMTIRDIEDVARRDRKHIQTVAESITDQLDLTIKLQTPENLLTNRVERLGIEEYEPDLKRLLAAVDDTYKGGRAPSSIAATITYIGTKAFDIDLTQREIADEFGVTTVTIRNRYSEVLENSSISPPREQRVFESFDEALSTLGDEIDLPEEVLERAHAHVTLAKPELENNISKSGVVLAAVVEAAAGVESYDPPALEELARYADVSANTIDRHRQLFE